MSAARRFRLDLDWVAVLAGALAAVSSAVALSTLGAAGTLAGAALGSVIVSVTSSIYGKGLSRGTEKVVEAQTTALAKVGVATQRLETVRDPGPEQPQPRADEIAQVLTQASEALALAASELERRGALAPTVPTSTTTGAEPSTPETEADAGTGEQPPASRRARLVALPWKRIGVGAAALFVVAMLLVTVFELATDRPISSLTDPSEDGRRGGTSITDVLGGGTGRDAVPDEPVEDRPARTPSPGGPATEAPPSGTDDPDDEPPATGTPSDVPTPSPSDDEPDEEPSEPSPTAPTTDPTAPTPTPTPTRTPGLEE